MLPAAALFLAAVSAPPAAAAAGTVRVAVAANFAPAAREVSARFERETGHRALLSSGSTGHLYAQILQGAPFEVFLAADEERPALAESAGLAVPGSRFTYAVGRLALYSREPGRITGPESLRSPPLARLALANPETAPYGRAALEVLERLGLGGTGPFDLVRGTNVAQAYQFVRTGNADAGFVALAQVEAGGPGGSHWIAPEEMHAPIRQQAVLLEAGAGNPAAAGFLRFLKSAPIREILRRRGYRPAEKAPRPPLHDRRVRSPRSVSPRGALPTGRRRESLRDSPRRFSRGGGHPLPAPLPGRRFAPTSAPPTFSTGWYRTED